MMRPDSAARIDASCAALPFAAVAGLDAVKQALLLVAVDPSLQGVLIRSGAGTGTSSLGRAFCDLLPEGAAFVELPPAATGDSLLGSLDWERTVATARVSAAPGLLSRAHGGALYADEAHLLDRHVAALIAGALNSSAVRIEREGISARLDSSFVLIGGYDAREGEVPPQLADSIALHVDAGSPGTTEERVQVMERAIEHDCDPSAFRRRYAVETERLRERIGAARAHLPGIRMPDAACRRLLECALEMRVAGHRADIFAVRAARAHAALAARPEVGEKDIEAAIEFVLRPRATGQPSSGNSRQDERAGGDSGSKQVSPPETGSAGDAGQQHSDRRVPAEQCPLPESLVRRMLESNRTPIPATGLNAVSRGTRMRSENARRGRYVRAAPANSRKGVVSVDGTLRAAAPLQILRSREADSRGIRITGDDLRFKRFAAKEKSLIVFAVDASGSMAYHRMNYAKGAVLGLLRRAYVHRDEVALISFRGTGATVLVPPTRSVERAKRLTQELAVGEGTPLAAGLEAAGRLVQESRRRGAREAMLVILTDGRANVSLRPTAGGAAIREEIESVGVVLRSQKLTSLVIDTSLHSSPNEQCETLARLIGARYLRLPRQAGDSAGALIEAAVVSLRRTIPTGIVT